MAININYHTKDNVLCISTEHNEVLELEIVENFYFKIMCEIFLDEPVILITKQPQEYSFGQGMEKSYSLKIKGHNVLINEINKCDVALLRSVCQSEEFRRGLLLLCEFNKSLSENEIEMILEATNNKGQNLSSYLKLIYCEDDGERICLHNTSLSIEYLQTLLS